VSLLSSIFILVFSSTKFDIGFIDKNDCLTILESMPIKFFLNSKNTNFPCCRTLYIVVLVGCQLSLVISNVIYDCHSSSFFTSNCRVILV
jgi:hypothetical protein